MANTSADTAWVDILPSMQGFLPALRGAVGNAAGQVGTQAGRDFGAGFQQTAVSSVEAASAKLAAARDKEADAAGKLRVAEQKLDDVRNSGRASAAQLVSAEENLARAQRGHASAMETTERAARNLNDSQEAGTKSAGQLEGALSGLGGKASGAATSGLDSIKESIAGLAAGAVGGAALMSAFWDNVSAGMDNDKLSAQLGLTEQDSARAGKVAGELYRNAYGDSLADVNEAVRAVVNNIGADFGDVDFQSITAKVMNLSTAFDVDLGDTTAAVGQLMRTGMAKDATEALDIVTAGFQSGIDKSGDFLDTLNEYGVQFNKLGIDGPVALGLLSQGLQAGARDSDLVADAIKEFSIRAVDGSKTTADGFKAIGLDAETMGSKIGQGGNVAEQALTLTLKKLREIPDPVARAQAATALFGSQAEDLGNALFALDPATASMANVAGAADRMDKTLSDNFGTRLEVWKRNLTTFAQEGMLALADGFSTGKTEAGGWQGALQTVGSVVRDVFDFLSGTAVPALQAFGGWVQDNTSWLVPLAGAVAAFAATLKVVTAVQTAYRAVLQAYAIWTYSSAAATGLFSGAMNLLKVAFLTNPIGIIIAALVALGVGLYLAWTHSETFRSIVMGALSAIGAAAVWVWENVLRPVFDALVVAWNAVAFGISWAWSNLIKPAWDAVSAAASWLWNTVLMPVFTAIGIGWSALVTGVQWAWDNILQPTWNFIQAAASFLLTFLAVVIFGPILLAWKALTIAFQWAWDNILHPVWIAVETAARWLWENVLTQIFTAIGFAWNLLLTGIQWAWDNVLHPVWIALEVAARWLWDNVLMPIWTAMGFAWNLLLTGIQWAWDNVLHPAWIALEMAARWLWENVLMPIFAAIGFAWNLLLTGIQWVWDNVLHPVWVAIETAARWLYDNVLLPIFRGLGIEWRWLMDGIQWVWDNVLHPVWLALEAAARWLWDNVLSPIFRSISDAWGAMTAGMQWAYDHIIKPFIIDPFAAAIGFLKGAFDTAVSGIQVAWDRIKGIAAIPINFVIRTVLRDGLFAAWNWVLDQLGIGSWHVDRNAGWLQGISGFAGGGQIDGPYQGPAADNMLALVGNDGLIRVNPHEWVQPVSSVDYYGQDTMEAIQQKRIPREVLATYATGGQIFDFTRRAFPRAKLNSAYRPGDPGYHGSNQAADMGEAGFSGGTGRPYIAGMKKWWVDNFGRSTEEIIYDGIGSSAATNVKNGAFHPYSAAIQAQHRNHLHVAETGALSGAVAGGPGGDGGGEVETPWYMSLWKTIEGAKNWLKDSIKSVGELAGRFGRGPLVGWLGELPGKIVGAAWDKISGTVGNLFTSFAANVSGSGTTPSGGSPALKQQAFQIGRSFGFSGAATEAAIDYIVSNESGWNPRAQNPTSTASGLWQHVRGTWQANRPNTASRFANMKDAPTDLQDVAGFNYIQGKFGNPVAARAYWQAHHYYDAGGMWPSGTLGTNTSGGDERVLAPEQDDYFRRFVDVADRVTSGDRRALIQTVNLNVRDNDTAFQAIDELEHRLRVADLGGRYAWTST
jgi:hypothetical protein